MRVVLRWRETPDPASGETRRGVADARRAVADALVRDTVAHVHGVDPEGVVTTRRCPRCGSARHGAPVARVRGVGEVGVSLSRAGSLVVAAVADGPVLGLGVDVERVGTRTAGLADLLAGGRDGGARTGPERGPDVDAVAAVAHADRVREPRADAPATVEDDPAVLRRWVRVEAVLKAAGVGLAVDPGDVTVEPPHRVLVPAPLAAPGWWVADADAVPGCVGAVALRLGARGPGDAPTLDAGPG
ncbi:4'-phosphopantetheinyl transferase family protein [Cellulomonas alba]|uniref:4'-phosphopantetheinyl transferase n=1 Tax=Cellulomonas alba TaxID=3053467 RepID=A0ABT7SIM6_9CELL|nr:hypothetical protein [Cellulomonas alba]MDM7856033.1 hypothetical protein [Cellulomonas alba]